MDNRHLCRAHIRKLGWIMDVVRINFDAETVELDFKDNADLWEYGFDEIDLLHCTGLSAQKSYRGTEPEDLLVFDEDIISTITDDEEPEIYRVIFEDFRWKLVNSNFGDQDLADFVNDYTTIEIIGTIHDGGGER